MNHTPINPKTFNKLHRDKPGFLKGYEHEEFFFVKQKDKMLVLLEESEKLKILKKYMKKGPIRNYKKAFYKYQ